jgi:hypothetical protein
MTLISINLLEEKTLILNNNNMSKIKWTKTDSNQWGRALSFSRFEFKERRGKYMHQAIIDLSDYNTAYVEDIISSYGYTLENINVPSYPNIYNIYGKAALWIIAESIFEMT